MKKSSIVFIIVGLIILGAVYYFATKKQPAAPSPQTPASSNQQAQSSQNQEPVQIVVVVNKSEPFAPKEYSVTQGQKVDIKVTSDTADELHFHGYDLHTELTPGQQGTIEFTANQTGRFEFELESVSKTLGVIDVNPK